jgi:hypothetical protein
MKKEVLLGKIESAKREIAAAESDLESAFRDMRISPRAEKTTISKVLEDAFAKLGAAKTNLLDLERLVVDDQD